MAERLEITRDIAAAPIDVYNAISDITRMGEWSSECHACEWTDGATGPAVGATFEGHNRNGDLEWTSTATVTAAEPGKEFVFECTMFDVHFSTWGYRIEDLGGTSRVTEWTDDLRPEYALEFATKMSGVADREGKNRETMSGTLERLAAALEA